MPTIATKLQDCAICEKKTNSVCSKCKSVSFCSIECQKMVSLYQLSLVDLDLTLRIITPQLHPVHKFLCGKDSSSFFFPPLNTNERDVLLRARFEAYDHVCVHCTCLPETKKAGATLIEHVNSLGLFEGNIECVNSAACKALSTDFLLYQTIRRFNHGRRRIATRTWIVCLSRSRTLDTLHSRIARRRYRVPTQDPSRKCNLEQPRRYHGWPHQLSRRFRSFRNSRVKPFPSSLSPLPSIPRHIHLLHTYERQEA